MSLIGVELMDASIDSIAAKNVYAKKCLKYYSDVPIRVLINDTQSMSKGQLRFFHILFIVYTGAKLRF